jgi:hypothetical protein
MGCTLWFLVWQEEWAVHFCRSAKTSCMYTCTDLYSERACIWILAGLWQSWLMFPCFSSVPQRKCWGCTLIRSRPLPSTSFQFISRMSPYLSMLYSQSYWPCHTIIYKRTLIFVVGILCFVDCASLYNLVNKANLVHNFS